MPLIKTSQRVNIPVHSVTLEGNLHLPKNAHGLVIFSHGSGSSRFSPRNNYVAEVLQEKNLGTLLFDLLTEAEDANYANRFDIDLLTKRLIGVTKWAQSQPEIVNLNIGYFGASTGAASALRAAASLGDSIKAVVSRGGRPDLAIPVLNKVSAPTLLIVGSLDVQVIQLNNEAFRELKGEKQMEVIPGASHLFEEPGKLEDVAARASEWFDKYL